MVTKEEEQNSDQEELDQDRLIQDTHYEEGEDQHPLEDGSVFDMPEKSVDGQLFYGVDTQLNEDLTPIKLGETQPSVFDDLKPKTPKGI